jgi:hypothetical protein
MDEDSMLPQGAILENDLVIEETMEPTKTYRIKNNRIVGFCDDIDALKQAIILILNTDRYEYLIYSWDYGNELKGNIGMDKSIAESEFKRRIQDALTQDDRINNVDNFIFEYDKDGALIRFTVFSIYGEFSMDKVVIT